MTSSRTLLYLNTLLICALAWLMPCTVSAGPKAGDKIYLIVNVTSIGDYNETHSAAYEPKGKHEIKTTDHFESTFGYKAVWEVEDNFDKGSDEMSLKLISRNDQFSCGGTGSSRKYEELWTVKGEKQKPVFDQSELVNANWAYQNAQLDEIADIRPVFSVKDKKFRIVNMPNLPVLVAEKCMPKGTTTTVIKTEQGSKSFSEQLGGGMWAHSIAGTAALSIFGTGGGMPDGKSMQSMKNDMIEAAAKAGVQLDAEVMEQLNAMDDAGGQSVIRDNSVKDSLTGAWVKPGEPFSITKTASYQATDKDLERASGEKQEPEPCTDNDSITSSLNGKFILSYTLSYNMEPEELEAVIIPSDGYEDKWLPEGGADEETPGSSVLVKVKLQVKDKPGKKPSQGAQFTYRLTNVSSEPGTCLNFPATDATSSSKDLRIRLEDNSEVEIQDNGMTAVTSAKDLTDSDLIVQCFDWGAYGSLRVTAQLEDGRKLEAYLQNNKKFNYLPIPMDENSNHIADIWENEQGVKDKAADADDETQPKGDGHEGDGLTLYEEYRGIMENGKHVRCNAKKKDFFICSKLGNDGEAGLNMFETLSGLEVHRKLTADEMGEDRVVNRNSSEKKVAQHGILVDLDPKAKGVCIADGNGPGTPKHTKVVKMSSDMLTGEEGPANVAHEILHACSVHHHGYGDMVPRFWVREVDPANPKGTVIMEYPGIQVGDKNVPDRKRGMLVKVYLESREPAPLASFKLGEEREFQLAVKHGEHSGDERCIMRYNCAQAYISEREKAADVVGIRYVINDKMDGDGFAGNMLCTSTQGLTINKPGRKPEPRYDSAAEGLGNCLGQICINNLHEHVPVQTKRNGMSVITRSSK